MKSLLGLLLALAVSAVDAAIIEGKVINVSDGDTITILDGDHQSIRIRLSGIDAPEKRQAFGERSRESLVRFVARKEVSADCHKVDRYKRQIA